ENRIVRGRSEDESAEKVPMFENDQKDDCLHNSNEAKRRTFLVKSAKNAFPNKYQQTTRASDASDLNEGKKYKKGCSENQTDPGLRGGANEAEENGSRHKEYDEVCERIEYHELRLCCPV